MKPKLIGKLQQLGRQAGQFRQVVESAPSHAARLREAIVLTAGQLQQLRSEIQTGIADLRADSGDQMLRSLGEIQGSTDILRQAGFELTGVDLELGLTTGQRVLLQLRRVERVPQPMIRALASANPGRAALRGVLAALERASELASTTEIPGLVFQMLTVAVGPVPSLRIHWRPAGEPSPAPSPVASPTLNPEPLPETVPAPPLLSGAWTLSPQARAGSILEPAVATPAAEASLALPTPEPPPTAPPRGSPPVPKPTPTPPPSTASKPLPPGWRTSALDRFKKMPDLTRR